MDKLLYFTTRASRIVAGIAGWFLCLICVLSIGWELYRHGLEFSCAIRTDIVGMVFGLGFFLLPVLLRELFVQQTPKDNENMLKRITPFFFLAAYVYLLVTCGGLLCQKPKQTPIPTTSSSDHV